MRFLVHPFAERKCDAQVPFHHRVGVSVGADQISNILEHKRPHQGIDNRAIFGSSAVLISIRDVVRIPRGGGLVNHNERVA